MGNSVKSRVEKGEVMNPVNSSFGVACRLLVTGVLLLPALTTAAQWEAQLQWVRTVSLSTPVSGVIATVSVDRGDRVSADQVLLQLEDSRQQAELAATEARLKQAKRRSVNWNAPRNSMTAPYCPTTIYS